MQFGDSLCPDSVAALCGLLLKCAPPSLYSVDCECVSCVLAASLSSLCAFRQLILKQQLTSYATAVKPTASSQVVSEQRWKVPKESTRQVVTGVGTTRVDEHCWKRTNERSGCARRTKSGIQDLLVEDFVEEVQAILFKGFFLVICGVLE